MGRPSSYTPELAAAICKRIAGGENLDRLSQEEGMPSKPALYEWLKKHAEFANEYAQARAMRADSRSDRIDEYGRQMVGGQITPEQARVLVDIEKWQAGKENPKRYGERVHQETTGADGGPIVTHTTVTLTPEEAYRKMLGGDPK